MKSLRDHNRDKVQESMHVDEPKKTGVSCPECEAEMIFVDVNVVLACIPPKMTVRCPECKHIDYMVV